MNRDCKANFSELTRIRYCGLTDKTGFRKKAAGEKPAAFSYFIEEDQPDEASRAPVWTFDECVERLSIAHQRTDLIDDLDPAAERQLCEIAKNETGIEAVFVTNFPLSSRPFYTHPAADGVHAAGFDLLLRGLEVTTGGQRLHRRADLERALRSRGIAPENFEAHLRMFDFGMPPHGGLAIGLERLTCQVLGLKNVREATLYPRDLNRLTP
jgi:nondiscriminating aspartyl-tRNA synthetase